jgi:hypothetical protein
MNPLFGGLLEGALIGAAVGLAVGVVMALLPGRPCPKCNKRLPKPLFGRLEQCPSCGHRLNLRKKSRE